MRNIPLINIADNEIWMVYLMPFDDEDRTDYCEVLKFQQECIEKKIIAMGWEDDCFNYGTIMTDENVEIYRQSYNKKAEEWSGSVSDAAVKGYRDIRKDDYVVMRLKNGHYFVGKVSSERAFFMHKPDDSFYSKLSWGATVDKWVEYENDYEIPSEIVGRFSQRRHSAIQRIAPYRQRLLVISMYENKLTPEERSFNIPKLNIRRNNFVRSLHYMQLEDLVSLYIYDKHSAQNYKLIPSSCKISEQNYEFVFVSIGNKPITCQVKNQSEIDIVKYRGETSYEKIYIFSGKWESESDINSQREKCKGTNIYVISLEELFATLIKYKELFANMFYDFDSKVVQPSELKLNGYNEVTRIRNDNEYTVSEDFVCFLRKDGFFYSAEFGALVVSTHYWQEDNELEEKNKIQKVFNDINSF